MGVQVHMRHGGGEHNNSYANISSFTDEDDVIIHAKGSCDRHARKEKEPFIVDYNQAINKPKINGHTLVGNLSNEELGLNTNTNDYGEIHKIKDYLFETYYDNLDYEYALNYFSTVKNDIQNSACTSIRKGKYFGRNLDWFYDNSAEFIVKTPHVNNRYAALGISSGIKELTNEVVTKGDYNILYKLVPFRMVDGINEKGLVISTNVVPTDKGINDQTIPVVELRDTICSLMVPRYVLDWFETAREAANYLRNYVAIYPPKALTNLGYEAHWMIADENETLLLEIIDNRVVITDMTEGAESHLAGKSYMTNFYLSDIRLNFDGSVFTPEYRDGSNNAITYNHITPNGCGLERYNIVSGKFHTLVSREDMRNLMKELYYTNGYRLSTNPIWCTEFVGLHGLNVASTLEEFMPTVRKAAEKYEHRTREDGTEYSGTWQTVHSVIYNIEDRTLSVIVQEDNNVLEYAYDALTPISDSGTKDYSQLYNKPQINNVELDGKQYGGDLKLVNSEDFLTNQEIEELLNGQL